MEWKVAVPQGLRDGEFKDASPVQTVERIRAILEENGIQTRERWLTTGVPYCHAVSVHIEGTTFMSTGKGLTKEFALASGYAELMERVQCGFLAGASVQKDGGYSVNDTQDRPVAVAELLAQDRSRYERMAQRLQWATGRTVTPEQLLQQYADAEGCTMATPFFSITQDRPTLFPAALRKRVYSSGGCAAGNTLEEAVVQGISEIVEHGYHLQIIESAMTPADVPDAFLQRFSVAWEIICFLRGSGLQVLVKDCSMGKKFPVVLVVLIDRVTGKYHTHFGAYPIFEIALERALTEAFQGRSLETVASFSDFIYDKTQHYSTSGFANEVTQGTWEKRPDLFFGQPDWPFREDVGFAGRNNRELMRECVEFFTEQGYEVLIRDVSALGFPTYQVLVPGYSEVFVNRLLHKLDDHRFAPSAEKTLRDPTKAGMEDMLGMLMHISEMQKYTGNTVRFRGFLAGAKLSAELAPGEDSLYLAAALAYVYYAMGKKKEAIANIDTMLRSGACGEPERLLCLKRWLCMERGGYQAEEIRQTLTSFRKGLIRSSGHSYYQTIGEFDLKVVWEYS